MSNRDISLAINIDSKVRGKESVVELTQRLDDMAKVLEGELNAQAQAAADKLRELARQQEAIAAFERLKREATEAAAALKRAETEAANFGQQIGQAGPPTAREAAAMQQLQAAADAARVKMVEQRTALAGAVAELQNYGIASKNTKDAQQRLAAEVERVRASVSQLAPAYQGVASGAEVAGAQIQRSHRAIGEGVDSISTQLSRVQNAFIALQGGGFLGGLIKDAAETADAYNGLAARIKLATGEGQAFQAGMEGVERVAVATRSSLEATGNLFTRLVASGKALGLTQQDALALTQTINQAIQVTGGGAQAAEAAITQLSQGLQSGTLRGDEFNSVMEQSPRLARALADGLGVGIGRLREMAEQGQLTAETVIKALRGQADTVASEFGKLPPTVGGALQNLSTAWTVYIGNVDKSTGASRAAAEGITYLATHLDGIVGTMANVGKGVLALTLLKLASHFKDWALGAGQATAALTANTAAAVANTAAAQANAVATSSAGAAAADAAAKKGLLSTAMGGVVAAGRGVVSLLGGPVGLLALTATYAKDLGELAAKLVLKAQGLKSLEEVERTLAAQEKRSYEQAQALAAERTRQVQADKDAALAKFGLSAAAKQLITDFDDLIKKGQTADEAISSIGKKFDLGSAPGIQGAAAVLDKLRADGKLTAEQFQQAWAQALDGKDLLQFETLAKAALQGIAREAEQTAQVMDATLREAIRRSGLDFDVISGGMSKASISALNDIEAVVAGLDRLKAQGIDTGSVLSSSLSKAINTADSQKSIDAVIARIESLRSTLGDKVTDGLLDDARRRVLALKDELDKAKPGINSVAEAMKVLGVTSQQSLQETASKFRLAYETMRSSGTATARELQDGFVKMAEATIAANGGVATEAIKVEAAMRGIKISTDAAGKSVIESMGGAATATRRVGDEASTAAGKFDKLSSSARGAAVAASEAAQVASGINAPKPYVTSTDKNSKDERIGSITGTYSLNAQFELWNKMRAGTLSKDDLASAKNALRISQENARLGSAGNVSLAGRNDDQVWISRMAQIVGLIESMDDQWKVPGGTSPESAGPRPPWAGQPGQQPPAPAPSPTPVPVVIQLPGFGDTQIHVASSSEARALEQLLARLSEAASRTGP